MITVTKNYVENIFNTLPVGYYLGRRISCTLHDEDVSYFDPASDSIFISCPSIVNAANNTTYTVDIEEIVRGLLYHEISHVILSPKLLMQRTPSTYRKVVNCVEDERIESILKSYYMGVNFKKNVIILNNFHNEPPKTAFEYFYQVVRFHIGEKKHIDMLNNILNSYLNINANTAYFSTYIDSIIRFYDIVCEDFNKNMRESSDSSDNSDNSSNSSNTSNSGETGSTKSSKCKSSKSSKDSSNSTSETTPENNTTSNSTPSSNDESSSNSSNDSNSDKNNNSNDNSDSENNSGSENSDLDDKNSKTSKDSNNNSEENSSENDNDMHENNTDDDKSAESMKEINEILDEIADLDIGTSDDIKKLITKAIDITINKYYDEALVNRFRQIIKTKFKKHKKNGSFISSYSGTLNKRLVGTRDDYEWWEQTNRLGHLRAYPKVHFNLFIDNSGSFFENDTRVNILIRSLEKINDPDFTFDIITINTRINEWPNTHNIFRSTGGNCLTNQIAEVIKRHTKPRTNNFNIVLFDGDAHSDDRRSSFGGPSDPFRHFDGYNTIIISDRYNKRYIDSSVKKARVKYTDNYCNEFIEEILNLLERML